MFVIKFCRKREKRKQLERKRELELETQPAPFDVFSPGLLNSQRSQISANQNVVPDNEIQNYDANDPENLYSLPSYAESISNNSRR